MLDLDYDYDNDVCEKMRRNMSFVRSMSRM